MKLRHLGAAALAFAFLAIAGGTAHARTAQPVVTCDRFGCSDWTKARPTKTHRQARRHPSNIGTPRYGRRAAAAGVVTVESAMGPVTVSPAFAPRIVPLIAELKDLGFSGIVKCFSPTKGNHVANSRHFSGNACDFLPAKRQARGKNRMPTPAMMFSRRVADAIARAGLRNGCTFNDCGHIDDGGGGVAVRPSWPRTMAQQ